MWHAAMLSRTDYKFPSYRQFVGVEQTPEEQAAVWRQAAQVFKLKQKTKKRKTRVVRVPAKVTSG